MHGSVRQSGSEVVDVVTPERLGCPNQSPHVEAEMLEDILDRIVVTDRLTARQMARSGRACNILSVGEDDPGAWGGAGGRVWNPLSDGGLIDSEDFVRAVASLEALWQRDDKIVVCCHAGESRSAAVVTGWLMLQRPALADSLPLLPSVFGTLDPLFQESHRWAVDDQEAGLLQVPKAFIQDPRLTVVLACYARLAELYPRVHLNVGLWCTLLRSDSV